ncbi:MAG: hypothetical protein ACJ76S_07900 [Solirubrobacteraceae bacterium]
MTRPTTAVVVAAAVMALGLAACGSGGASNGASKGASSATPPCPKPPNVNPANFVSGVDNPLFPLKPGTTYRYEGTDDGDPAVEVVLVTNQTKRIVGVDATVVRDRTYISGKLAEDTRDWYAQDKAGNVWYFGENTTEWDDGHASTEGSWQAGVKHARAGIFLPAKPAPGHVFKQEDAKGVSEDCGQILDLQAPVKTPHVSTGQALRTKEWNPLEPGAIDNKYYVRDVGLVREQTVQGGTDLLQLVSVGHG